MSLHFIIGPMRADEYEQCVRIACKAFTTNNPVTMHLGTPSDAFKELVYAEASRATAVDSGLSLVARDAEGSVMAFLFLVVMDAACMSLPEHIPKLHHGLATMVEIIDEAYDTALLSPYGGLNLASLTGGQALRCAFGGTAPSINGKGIGKALRLRAVAVARERGFRTLLVEPGHGATRHIWTAHCNGKIRAEIPFDTYKAKNGALPCKGVEGSLAVCEILVRPSFWDHAVLWPVFVMRLLWQTRDWQGVIRVMWRVWQCVAR